MRLRRRRNRASGLSKREMFRAATLLPCLTQTQAVWFAENREASRLLGWRQHHERCPAARPHGGSRTFTANAGSSCHLASRSAPLDFLR
jgi:hypothetical protein